MKNFNTIALAVLALAVIGLYVLHFSSKSAESVVAESNVVIPDSTVAVSSDSLTQTYPIAYINVDTFFAYS